MNSHRSALLAVRDPQAGTRQEWCRACAQPLQRRRREPDESRHPYDPASRSLEHQGHLEPRGSSASGPTGRQLPSFIQLSSSLPSGERSPTVRDGASSGQRGGTTLASSNDFLGYRHRAGPQYAQHDATAVE